MVIDSTQKKWVIVNQERGIDGLQLNEGPIPKVDDYGVLVKIHAAALNYRDLMIPRVS
jgi:NADPH:quinone reductase-like Zn-dependent oxidoreductase